MDRENRYTPITTRSGRYSPISETEQTPIPSTASPQPTLSQTPAPEPVKKPSIWNTVAKAILPKGAEDYFGLNEKPASPTAQLLIDSARRSANKVFPFVSTPEQVKMKEAFDKAALPILNSPQVAPILKQVSEKTSGTGIYSAIQAIGPKTFSEAYEANRQAQAGDPSKWHQFLYQLGDTAPQTAIGVALNFVPYAGRPLSLAYWTALSAEEQVQSKGAVTSTTNIGIDVALDSVLGKTIESLFKAPAKSLFDTLKKTFTAEGGTEVSQDLLKLANDYREAKTLEGKAKALKAAKEYFTSGQILMTLGVGGLTGAGIGAGVYAAQNQEKIKEGVKDYIKNPKIGMTVEEVGGPPPPPPGGTLAQKAIGYESAEEFAKNTMVDSSGDTFVYEKSAPDEAYYFLENDNTNKTRVEKGDLVKEYMKGGGFVSAESVDLVGKVVSRDKQYLVIRKITKSEMIDIYNQAVKKEPMSETDKMKQSGKSVEQLQEEYEAGKPGHKKFNDYLDTAVQNGTFFPEEAVILKTLFEDTNDRMLAGLKFEENGRLTRALGRYSPALNRIQMQKGLSSSYNNIPDETPSQSFVHEFGHAGWYTILTQEERDFVTNIFRGMHPQDRRALFPSSNRAYYASNAKEFWAQAFSDYIFENKVPAPQMKSLLKRVAESFYEGLKKLVTRNQPDAVKRMRPLYEKILAGDKTTPLSEFAKREPPSFKKELQAMFNKLDKPTKEVPVETLAPIEPQEDSPSATAEVARQKAVQGLPPDIGSTIEPLEAVAEGKKRTPIAERIGLIDKLRTPWRVMKKLGVYTEYRKLIAAYEAYVLELPGNINKITEWSKRVSKESNQRIFQFLDGKEIELNAEETKVASEVKVWLAQWADRLGMEKDARISDYITHIFPRGKGGEIPEEIATLIRNKAAKSIYNPFLLHRQGAEGYIEDTWGALDAYVKRATRKVNIDPALEEFNQATAHLTEESQIDYLEKRISTLNMRPTRAEKDIDNTIQRIFPNIGPRATMRITTSVRKMISRAKIALSFTSFAKNLTQGINTWSELGNKYTKRGYLDLRKFGGQELIDNSVLRDSFYEDRTYSAIKRWAEKADRGLFLNMTASEYINRGAAYYGAKSKFIEGKTSAKDYKLAFGKDIPAGYTPTLEDAIQYGKFIAEKTQFLFGPLETPHYTSGPIAKTAVQFSTFGMKQAEYIGQMVSDREFAKLARYLIGSSLLFHFIGGAFGMRWDDSIKTFRWGLPPVLQFLKDIWGEGIIGEDKYGNKLDTGGRAKAVGESLFTNVMPGGAQLKKSYEGLTTVMEGASRTKSGQLQYKVDQTPGNYIRGTLFGKYNLPASREYYKKKEDKAKAKTKSSGSREGRYDPI